MSALTIAPKPIRTLSATDTGGRGVVDDFIGNAVKRHRGPQAFRVTRPPGYVIEPHFHRCDQYQVFVSGRAKYGTIYDLDPVSIHYADAFTTYGPIIVQEEEMAFFNLRSHSDTGAYYMPGSREAIEMRGGRTTTVYDTDNLSTSAGPAKVETLVEPHADGLSVEKVVSGPGELIRDHQATGSGCSLSVWHMSIRNEAQSRPPAVQRSRNGRQR
jgi:hypothetical protein